MVVYIDLQALFQSFLNKDIIEFLKGGEVFFHTPDHVISCF